MLIIIKNRSCSILKFTIIQELAKDYKITEKVIEAAFANAEHTDHHEHILVSKLRKTAAFFPELSLVAKDHDSDKTIGHILLSKIKIQNENESYESLALAPLSVLPEYQNKGVGKELILKALKTAKDLRYHSVVVLGHPDYYPKFGFQKASIWGIKAPFDVPEAAFMAIELFDNALNQVSGVIEYPGAFFE
jgi:predicted N-acetyltransferase YhbS